MQTNQHEEYKEYEKLKGSAVYDRPKPAMVPAQKHTEYFSGNVDSCEVLLFNTFTVLS